jgi:4-hydroxy-2-oxoglutarate aldolase
MIEGICIAAVTPFRNQEVDEEAMAKNFERWNKTDVAGYLILGSTGEFVHLRFEEKVRVLKVARSLIPEEKVMIAGIGCESVAESLDLAHKAEEIGADILLAVTPHYYKPALKPPVLKRYFREIADRISKPLYLYNIPQFTGVELSAATVRELAEHPKIQGVKDSSGHLPQIVELGRMKDRINVLVGHLPTFIQAMMSGVHGAIFAFANAVPAELCEIYSMLRGGDVGKATRVINSVQMLNRRTIGKYGIPGLKELMRLMGYEPGEPRLPLAPLSGSAAREVAAALKDFERMREVGI